MNTNAKLICENMIFLFQKKWQTTMTFDTVSKIPPDLVKLCFRLLVCIILICIFRNGFSEIMFYIMTSLENCTHGS